MTIVIKNIQESLADAKVSARQQCVYEDPYRRNLQQMGDSLRDARDICTLQGGATNTLMSFGNRIKCFQLASMLKKIVQ